VIIIAQLYIYNYSIIMLKNNHFQVNSSKEDKILLDAIELGVIKNS